MSTGLDKSGIPHLQEAKSAVKEPFGLGIAGTGSKHHHESRDILSSSHDPGARAVAEYHGWAATRQEFSRGGPTAANDSGTRMDAFHHGRSHPSPEKNPKPGMMKHVEVGPRNPVSQPAIKQEMPDDMPYTIQRSYGPPIPHPMPDPATLNGKRGNGTKHKLNEVVHGNNDETDTTDKRRIRRKLSDEDRDADAPRIQKTNSFAGQGPTTFMPSSSSPERRPPLHSQGSFSLGCVPSSSAPETRPTLTPGSSFNNSTTASPQVRSPHDTPPTSQAARNWGRVLSVPRFNHLTDEQRRDEEQRADLRMRFVQAEREALETAIKLRIVQADELRQQLIYLNLRTSYSAVDYAADL
ncbi:uncharacterized protein BDZ99DRAFT_522855 [Mytilinidion resinicola]|uniref:Uncharacterized protein n=1 Tax=Mytilinidion resinicola TaxID=574789 RepID=A0A6A6YH62_9PEZI|nr:uncharacterized protein BDZ99DRAFT_522855 [Mytilinidion resinicola]KAF2807237.1 hypothetical protein BDZ99DRAFT_522855 [Mytilinidion resinicola]